MRKKNAPSCHRHCKEQGAGDAIPSDGLKFIKELGLHHGDLIDDEVSAAGPLLQDTGAPGQLQTSLQRGGTAPNAWVNKHKSWEATETIYLNRDSCF